MKPEAAKPESKESSVFRSHLNFTIARIHKWEQDASGLPNKKKSLGFAECRRYTQEQISGLPDNDRLLFETLFDLMAHKHDIGELNKIYKSVPRSQRHIGSIGAIAVGKSTLTNTLQKDLRAGYVGREPLKNNPYWLRSLSDPSFMLRSQMYFLLSNIFSDMAARNRQPARKKAPISVADTSTWADALMWVEWYKKRGKITQEDYESYQKLLSMVKDVIPKPDLLVGLVPDSLDHLYQGLRNRKRKGEKVFTKEDVRDLVEISASLIDAIPTELGIPVLKLEVNPLDLYAKPHLRYDAIYQIRRKLGLLGDLLKQQPEEIADRAMKILAPSGEAQIIIIHAESMFTGKTTALCKLADKVGARKILAFQPKESVRDPKQRKMILSRDGPTLKSHLIQSNDLRSILSYIRRQNITPKQKPYIFIDEIELFTENRESEKEPDRSAIKVLEQLRAMGFHVVVDGIDYTFQEEPFTFMHDILAYAKQSKNWHSIKTATRCRYCNEEAQGSRRWVYRNGAWKIAPYSDQTFLAGSDVYEPVCCKNHASCTNKPKGFRRKELPH